MTNLAPPSASPDPAEDSVSRGVQQQQLLKIGALVVAAMAAFLLTRTVAANNRAMTAEDAAAWYQRGQVQLASAQYDAAIQSLRRSTSRARGERRYMLALADALARRGEYAAARSTLIELRDQSPDDPEINLRLARLAAGHGDVQEAVRFYHNALYSPSTAEQAEARRAVRLELVRVLLDHNDTARADAELLALASDTGETAAHVRLARLFEQAHDLRRALDHFTAALRRAPTDPEALTGAGVAAFQLGDYAAAHRYLASAPPDQPDVRHAREVTDFVLSSDPLGAGLTIAKRRQAVMRDMAYVAERLRACGTGPAGSALDGLQQEVDAFQHQLDRRRVAEGDLVDTGASLIDRAALAIADRCGTPSARDEALAIVARRHGTANR